MVQVRINKYISDTGFCSRREADKLVEDARVEVNGAVAVPGTKVGEEIPCVSMERYCVPIPIRLSSGLSCLNPRNGRYVLSLWRTKIFLRIVRIGVLGVVSVIKSATIPNFQKVKIVALVR